MAIFTSEDRVNHRRTTLRNEQASHCRRRKYARGPIINSMQQKFRIMTIWISIGYFLIRCSCFCLHFHTENTKQEAHQTVSPGKTPCSLDWKCLTHLKSHLPLNNLKQQRFPWSVENLPNIGPCEFCGIGNFQVQRHIVSLKSSKLWAQNVANPLDDYLTFC